MSRQTLPEEPIAEPAPGEADQATILAIATDTSTPIEIVTRLFVEELSTLWRQARIKQFVGILVAQRLRRKLRELEAPRAK